MEEFLLVLVGGAVIGAIALGMDNFLKWPLMLAVLAGVLGGVGLITYEDVQGVQSVCPGSSTDACSIIQFGILALLYATWQVAAGLVVGGLLGAGAVDWIKKRGAPS